MPDQVGHDAQEPGMTKGLELAPDHFVDDAGVGLDDADDFGGDVFVDVVGDGEAGEAVADEGDGNVYTLE